MGDAAQQSLARALAISQELVRLAESGDVAGAMALDAERIAILREVRAAAAPLSSTEQALIAEIAALNDRAVGLFEHRLRIKARELDLAAVGRRAVLAYAATG